MTSVSDITHWFGASRMRMMGLLLLSVVGYVAGSWMYFGGAEPGAFVYGGGVGNGVYSWTTHPSGRLLLNPASEAIRLFDSSPRVPTAMELLVQTSHASDFTEANPRRAIQRQANSRGVQWLIGLPPSTIYYSYAAPKDASAVVPPETGWTVGSSGVEPLPQLWPRGSRPATGHDASKSSKGGAMEKLLESPAVSALRKQPVTCLIIAVCCYIWHKLRQKGWGWPEVGSSYRNVVYEGEVWRLITASFSHVDLLHLVMNMMSLYQCGWLEEMYGSVLYSVYSIGLVVSTMVVSLLMYHIMITRFGKTHYIETIGVGYSCVLFALIVIATAKTEKYCPLPGLQQVCFPTWKIPLPLVSVTLPFNLAPFGLLLAMHFIVPKASFIGHLSGIILGYPLVWGLLEWLSPRILVRFCVVAILTRDLLSMQWSDSAAPTGGHTLSSSGSSSIAASAFTPSAIRQFIQGALDHAPDGRRSSVLLLMCLVWLASTVVTLFMGSWLAVICDVTGVLGVYTAWRFSASVSSTSSDYQLKVLLGCAALGLIDAADALARLPTLVSASGGYDAWTAGLVPSSFVLGVVCVGVLAVLGVSLAFVCVSLVKGGSSSGATSPMFGSAASAAQQSGSTGAFWFLPASLRPAFGGQQSSSIVQNGVLSRNSDRLARLAALDRSDASEGRRLGSV